MKSPALVLAALTSIALADPRGDTPGSQPSTPQEQLAKFHVPPGFEVQLVAAEPQIQKPINLNFDAAGRLWVTGSELYPWPASTDVNGHPIPDFEQGWKGMVESFSVGDAPQPSATARDSVRILSDLDATGLARRITVFADRLNIPSGIQPLPRKAGAKGDTAIVYSIPDIWLMTDVDGDGFAEKREPLYTGFGYTDTHGGSSSYIYWIDGWIYSTHGFKNHSEVRDRNGRVTVVDSGNTCRFRPDGSAFEIYAHGQTNPFGLTFDPLGNLFSADSHSKPVYMLLRGGYYEGIGKQHDGLGFAPRITDDDHGSSAIAGIAYYADDKWPAEYRGNLFNGNPVTQRINRDRLEWHGSTPRAIRMPDFLTCDDPWFRPVNLKLGPDGALYIADFYNPIIGHYEVPLTHPSRDHTHGRIWRVVWRGKGAATGSASVLEHLPKEVSTSAAGKNPVHPANPANPVLKKEDRIDRMNRITRQGHLAPALDRVPGDSPATDPAKKSILDAPAANSGDQKGISADPTPTNGDRKAISGDRKGIIGDPNPISGDRKGIVGDQKSISRDRNPIDGDRNRTNGDSISISVIPNRIKGGGPMTNLGQKGVSSENPPIELPNLAVLDAPALVGKLAYPSLEVRRLATNELVDRVGATRALEPLEGRYRNDIPTSPAHIELSLWAFERLGAGTIPLGYSGSTNNAVRIQALKILAERKKLNFDDARSARFDIGSPKSTFARPAGEVLARHPSSESIGFILKALEYAKPEDTLLTYGLRMALRDNLLVNNGFKLAMQIDAKFPEQSARLADVSLAIPTLDSAAFLLAHLERTQLETPRAGEYLKHAMLHLPAEKLDAVVKLVAQVRGNAPLPQRLALATNLADAARQRSIALSEELTAWSQGVIFETLASNNDQLTKPAIAALRDVTLEAKLAPLEKIARDEFRDEALRLAALESLANLPASRALLAATLADPRHFKLRKRAAELLVGGGFSEILAALPTAPFDLAQSMAGDLINHGDDGCAALLDAIDAGQASPRLLRNRLIEIVLSQRGPELQARAAALTRDLPPLDERLDQLIAQRAKDFAQAQPNAEHGAQLFQQHCAVCHRIRNEGGNVGPNLDGVVTRGTTRLIEDILDPNRNVDPAFRQTIVETHDGQMFAGTNVREQGDAVLLIDATGQELSVAKSAIKTRTASPLSLMPPAFEAQLAPRDLEDLLAHLLAPMP